MINGIRKITAEEMELVSGGKLAEDRKRYIQVLIRKAKRDPEMDATCFLNEPPGDELNDEEMDYVCQIWDYIH